MRSIHVDREFQKHKNNAHQTNYYLSDDMKNALYKAADQEENPLGCQILNQLKENHCAGRRTDTNLSGYWNGCRFCGSRTGCTY